MEHSLITLKYWSEVDRKEIINANDFKDLYIVAERIILRMPKPIVQVCGPIGTGGLGNPKDNLAAFDAEIKKLQAKGLNVFDQMPFEWPMQAMKFKLSQDVYPEAILTDFYLPIFNSGHISEFYFMDNWQTSKGATWEHDKAKELGIKINYL